MKMHILFFIGLIFFSIACEDNQDQDGKKTLTNKKRINIAKEYCINPPASSDYREYQHGIDFIPINDTTYYLIWGSTGINPSGSDENGSWPHDIYYSTVSINRPGINPITLIGAPKAQEPPSTAISSDGNIFITMEDSYNVENGIAQRYAVYNSEMDPINDYPNMVYDGGHSAHVASVNDKFVVFWSDDWDASVPGADGIGTGKDVLADIYSSTGVFIKRINVATGGERDWWPIIAGSENHVCLIWQRYVEGDKYCNLHYSILDTETGSLIKNDIEIEQALKYYTYDVQYYSKINRFMIVGTYYNGGGFAYLLDNQGNIIDEINAIPEIVREAQGITNNSNLSLKVVYACQPNGAMVLSLTENKISYEKTIQDDYEWYGIGTDGIFLNDTTVYIISLSPCGLINRTLELN